MKTITLWYLDQLGLIILCNSGVTYTNQVGGYACLQESAEGALAIIDDYNREALGELIKCTLNIYSFTDEKASEVDLILSKYGGTGFLSVDMDMIRYSKEAWIYVNIKKDYNTDEIAGFAQTKGILTWENSD